MFELQMANSPLELTSGMQCPFEKKLKGRFLVIFFFGKLGKAAQAGLPSPAWK